MRYMDIMHMLQQSIGTGTCGGISISSSTSTGTGAGAQDVDY